MTHTCVSKPNHHWFRYWLVAWLAASHYLNQCWNVVNSNPMNKHHSNLKRNSYISIQESVFENAVCEMVTVLSRPQCANYIDKIILSGFFTYQFDECQSSNAVKSMDNSQPICSCNQAALWKVQSVRPSVRLSVCPSHLFHYVPIIVASWNLLPMTNVMFMQKVKIRGQRSRSQMSNPTMAFPDCNSRLNSHMIIWPNVGNSGL